MMPENAVRGILALCAYSAAIITLTALIALVNL